MDELVSQISADGYKVELNARTIAEEGHMLIVTHPTKTPIEITDAVEFIAQLIKFDKTIRPVNKEKELPNTKTFHIHD